MNRDEDFYDNEDTSTDLSDDGNEALNEGYDPDINPLLEQQHKYSLGLTKPSGAPMFQPEDYQQDPNANLRLNNPMYQPRQESNLVGPPTNEELDQQQLAARQHAQTADAHPYQENYPGFSLNAPPVQDFTQHLESRLPYIEQLDAEHRQYMEDLQRGKISSQTANGYFFDGKTTLGKIGTLFALMVSAGGAAVAGQKNPYLEMMSGELERDLERQKASQDAGQNWYKLAQQYKYQKFQERLMGAQTALNQAEASFYQNRAQMSKIEMAEALERIKKLRQEVEKLGVETDQQKLINSFTRSQLGVPTGDVDAHALNLSGGTALKYLQDQVNKLPDGPAKQQHIAGLQAVAEALELNAKGNNAKRGVDAPEALTKPLEDYLAPKNAGLGTQTPVPAAPAAPAAPAKQARKAPIQKQSTKRVPAGVPTKLPKETITQQQSRESIAAPRGTQINPNELMPPGPQPLAEKDIEAENDANLAQKLESEEPDQIDNVSQNPKHIIANGARYVRAAATDDKAKRKGRTNKTRIEDQPFVTILPDGTRESDESTHKDAFDITPEEYQKRFGVPVPPAGYKPSKYQPAKNENQTETFADVYNREHPNQEQAPLQDDNLPKQPFQERKKPAPWDYVPQEMREREDLSLPKPQTEGIGPVKSATKYGKMLEKAYPQQQNKKQQKPVNPDQQILKDIGKKALEFVTPSNKNEKKPETTKDIQQSIIDKLEQWQKPGEKPKKQPEQAKQPENPDQKIMEDIFQKMKDAVTPKQLKARAFEDSVVDPAEWAQERTRAANLQKITGLSSAGGILASDIEKYDRKIEEMNRSRQLAKRWSQAFSDLAKNPLLNETEWMSKRAKTRPLAEEIAQLWHLENDDKLFDVLFPSYKDLFSRKQPIPTKYYQAERRFKDFEKRTLDSMPGFKTKIKRYPRLVNPHVKHIGGDAYEITDEKGRTKIFKKGAK